MSIVTLGRVSERKPSAAKRRLKTDPASFAQLPIVPAPVVQVRVREQDGTEMCAAVAKHCWIHSADFAAAQRRGDAVPLLYMYT